MPIRFESSKIEQDLDEFNLRLEAIDMDSVKRKTLKRTANAMAELVRQAVVAEDDIQSPAGLLSPYESGPGAHMATLDAWHVHEKSSGQWVVEPKPQVRQRATVLNFGYPGMITPNNADALRFTVNGVPVFRESVQGPDRTGYWQAAFRRMEKSDKLRQIANEELDEEITEVFR